MKTSSSFYTATVGNDTLAQLFTQNAAIFAKSSYINMPFPRPNAIFPFVNMKVFVTLVSSYKQAQNYQMYVVVDTQATIDKTLNLKFA